MNTDKKRDPENVEEIVKQFLKAKALQGLYDPEGMCSCTLPDLCPCQSPFVWACKPGTIEQCQGIHK